MEANRFSVKPDDTKGIMKREHIRAGRALLGWSQDDLSKASGVSVPTIKRYESDTSGFVTTEETLGRLQAAFGAAGVYLTTDVESYGLYYTPQTAIDDAILHVPHHASARALADPAVGSQGFLGWFRAKPKPEQETIDLQRYHARKRFKFPVSMADRIRSGESALKVFSEFRDRSTGSLAFGMLNNPRHEEPLIKNVVLTEEQIKALEFIPLDASFVASRLALILDIHPDYLNQRNSMFNPPKPPDDLLPMIRLMAARVTSEAEYWRSTRKARPYVWETDTN